MFTILIAEDDTDILELLTLYLENNSYKIILAKNGLEAWEIFKQNKIDLILVDIVLPEMNGYELIKKIRSESEVPIIVMSAKNQDSDRILGLNLGADLYISKPFNPLEVVAYIQAILRRTKQYQEYDKSKDRIIHIGNLSLELDEYVLKKNGHLVPMTRAEFKILAKMMQQPNRVFTKAQLYECINGELYESDDNTMMVHISNIRSKIEEDPSNPKYVLTVRGLGYKFENKE